MSQRKIENKAFGEFEASRNTIEITQENFDYKLSRFLNSCHRMYDEKDSRKFLLKFSFDKEIESIDEVSYYGYMTLGFVAKFFADNKLPLSFHKETEKWFIEKVNELKNSAKKRPAKSEESLKERGHNIQTAIIQRVRETMGEIDQFIDDNKFLKKWSEDFDIIDYLVSKNLSGIHGRKMTIRLVEEQNEFKEIESDEQLKEGYKFLSKKQIIYIIALYEYVIGEIEKFISLQNNKRKQASKPKVAKIEKVLENFKYMPESEDLKMASINPAEIIGSKMLVVYDSKYKSLRWLVAEEGKALQIKGTTVCNVDIEMSLRQTLRKPKEALEVISKISRREFFKFVAGLTTKPAPANSTRTNADCLLVNVYR